MSVLKALSMVPRKTSAQPSRNRASGVTRFPSR
jgi:hypothetical protein